MIKRIARLTGRYLVPGSSVSFWHTPIAAVHYEPEDLNDYPIDFVSKTAYRGPFDEAGIPVLDYRGEIGRQYNPCATAQFALGWFQLWQRNGDEGARKRFFDLADWLLETLDVEVVGGVECGFWLYQFDLDAYGVKAPWKSALAQAQGVSVLVRASRFASGKPDAERYRKAADHAYEGMVAPVDEGGLLRDVKGDLWLEEVVADRLVAILDGCLFALFGVNDYHHLVGDKQSANLFTRGAETIAKNLPLFDLGYWSRADLYQSDPPMPASPFYHNLHIRQLEVMHQLTGDARFATFARTWQAYQDNRLTRLRALVSKSLFKLRYY